MTAPPATATSGGQGVTSTPAVRPPRPRARTRPRPPARETDDTGRPLTAAEIQEARIREAVEREVASAPPLSDETITRLKAIFRPVLDGMGCVNVMSPTPHYAPRE